jgi:hypothetical protein
VIRTGDPIDLTLEDISASLADLPTILEDQERGELSEHERDVLSMEWIREVHHLRRILDPAYRSGRMTPAPAGALPGAARTARGRHADHRAARLRVAPGSAGTLVDICAAIHAGDSNPTIGGHIPQAISHRIGTRSVTRSFSRMGLPRSPRQPTEPDEAGENSTRSLLLPSSRPGAHQ